MRARAHTRTLAPRIYDDVRTHTRQRAPNDAHAYADFQSSARLPYITYMHVQSLLVQKSIYATNSFLFPISLGNVSTVSMDVEDCYFCSRDGNGIFYSYFEHELYRSSFVEIARDKCRGVFRDTSKCDREVSL